jgi:hypothetical protein
MKIKRTAKSKHAQFEFPTPMYFIAKLVSTYPFLGRAINRTESTFMQKRIKKTSIIKPTYITGIARAGTTVMLEMLSQHPDVATHKYMHMVLPYAPRFVAKIADYLPIMTKPTERMHKDGLVVTRDSPEAVEEIFWQRYFDNAMDESKSNILDATTSNPKFEAFYKEHLKKLIVYQHATRYVAKNNYNVTRMEYLQKLFSDVRFILMIRNPFNHIASLSKQDALFTELEGNDPRLLDWTKIIGHREFGTARVCINPGDNAVVNKVRELWENPQTYAQAWAIYWDAIYSLVDQKLNTNSRLAKAVLIVRYEDLCNSPSEQIDRIISHLELDANRFKDIKSHYVGELKPPSYYRTKYSDEEQDAIIRITHDTAKKFGYEL